MLFLLVCNLVSMKNVLVNYSLKILFTCLFALNIIANNISDGLKIAQIINCSDQPIFINSKLIKLKQNRLGRFKSNVILPYNSCADTAKCLLVSRSLSDRNNFQFLKNSLKIKIGKSEELAIWYNEQGVYCLSTDTNCPLKKIFSFSQDLSNAEKIKLISIVQLLLTIHSCKNSVKQDCRLKLSIS